MPPLSDDEKKIAASYYKKTPYDRVRKAKRPATRHELPAADLERTVEIYIFW